MSRQSHSSASPPSLAAAAAAANTISKMHKLPPLPHSHPHTLPLPLPALRPYSFVDRTLHDIAIPSPSSTQPITQSPNSEQSTPSVAGFKRSHTEQTDLSDRNEESEGGEEREGSPGGGGEEKGGNGRFLKQTKRAAQNRAAQQAFRKRKEERIRILEEKEIMLSQMSSRERELDRREAAILERERASVDERRQNETGSIASEIPRSHVFGPPASEALQTQNVTNPPNTDPTISNYQLQQTLESLRQDLRGCTKILTEKNALINSLRRSLGRFPCC